MLAYISYIRQVNHTFVKLMDELSIAGLNDIPEGFSNNIIWNFAHLLSVQQSVFYSLSGLLPRVDASFITQYRRGTKPEKQLNENEVDNLKDIFSKAINTFEEDYKNGLFTSYKTYETSVGITLRNIDDAIFFSTVHDGLHLGYARALKRFVGAHQIHKS